MLLANDVAHVTTIEYAETVLSPRSAHLKETELELPARWAWRHPSDVARMYLDGSWRHVDVAYSYSSLEHDGLGTFKIQTHSRPRAPSATHPRPTPSLGAQAGTATRSTPRATWSPFKRWHRVSTCPHVHTSTCPPVHMST